MGFGARWCILMGCMFIPSKKKQGALRYEQNPIDRCMLSSIDYADVTGLYGHDVCCICNGGSYSTCEHKCSLKLLINPCNTNTSESINELTVKICDENIFCESFYLRIYSNNLSEYYSIE